MTNEESSRIPLHSWRINLSEDWEVRFWSDKFGCSPEVLRDAIAKVGPLASAVKDHLTQGNEDPGIDSDDPAAV